MEYESEAKRQKVTTTESYQDIKVQSSDYLKVFSIEPSENGFALLDCHRNVLAHSKSNNALSRVAFEQLGALEVEHHYDLATGDDGR